MTSDEIRKLVSGYATGTLTESERALLFEAALEDQELFDELAREQALKELLDEPGVKQRLIAALEQPRPIAWWKRRWTWAAAGVVVTVVMLVFLTGPDPQPEQPTEIAAVTGPATPASQTPSPPPSSEPASGEPSASKPGSPTESSVESKGAVSLAKQKAASADERRTSPRVVASGGVAGGSVPEPGSAPAASQAASQVALGPASVARLPQAPQSPRPASGQPTPQQTAQRTSQQTAGSDATTREAVTVTSAANALLPNSSDAPSPAPAPPPPPAGRAMRAMAPAAARSPGTAEPLGAIGRFAFDYAVRPDGHLEIRSASTGYLRVTAAIGGESRLIFPINAPGILRGGSTTNVEIPTGATELNVLFTARPPEPVAAETGGVAPAALDAQSGTAEDPRPTADSRLQIRIRVKPRE